MAFVLFLLCEAAEEAVNVLKKHVNTLDYKSIIYQQ